MAARRKGIFLAALVDSLRHRTAIGHLLDARLGTKEHPCLNMALRDGGLLGSLGPIPVRCRGPAAPLPAAVTPAQSARVAAVRLGSLHEAGHHRAKEDQEHQMRVLGPILVNPGISFGSIGHTLLTIGIVLLVLSEKSRAARGRRYR